MVNWILTIVGGIMVLIVISFLDYFWTGKKVIGESPLKPKHLLMFYFTRSLAELIVFMFGVLLGWRMTCSLV